MESYTTSKADLRKQYESSTIKAQTHYQMSIRIQDTKHMFFSKLGKTQQTFFVAWMKFSSSLFTPLGFYSLILCLGSFLEITKWTWILNHWKCSCSDDKWMIWLYVSWLSENSAPSLSSQPELSLIVPGQNAMLQFLGMQNRSPMCAFERVNKHWWISTSLW